MCRTLNIFLFLNWESLFQSNCSFVWLGFFVFNVMWLRSLSLTWLIARHLKQACDLLMPWSNYAASYVSVCQLHYNSYVPALCKKTQEILEYLTGDVWKNTAFQKVCSLRVVIQAKYWKMQVSFPEHLKLTWQDSLFVCSWKILLYKSSTMQWMCFWRKVKTGRLLSSKELIFNQFWRSVFSL